MLHVIIILIIINITTTAFWACFSNFVSMFELYWILGLFLWNMFDYFDDDDPHYWAFYLDNSLFNFFLLFWVSSLFFSSVRPCVNFGTHKVDFINQEKKGIIF
jgi:hypothetical protein